MKYHEIEMTGKFWVEVLASAPAWTANDEGRLIYIETGDLFYYGTSTAWTRVAAGNLSLYALKASDNAWTATQSPNTNNGYNLGQTGKRWNTVYATTFDGTTTTATYADVAEIYKTSEELPIGTVVMVDWQGSDDTEVIPTMGITDDVIGVISEKPGFLLNKGSEGQAVGLIGKLPIRVVGKIKKGSALSSGVNGTASKYKGIENGSCYKFAYALENKDTVEEGLIMCLLKK